MNEEKLLKTLSHYIGHYRLGNSPPSFFYKLSQITEIHEFQNHKIMLLKII